MGPEQLPVGWAGACEGAKTAGPHRHMGFRRSVGQMCQVLGVESEVWALGEMWGVGCRQMGLRGEQEPEKEPREGQAGGGAAVPREPAGAPSWTAPRRRED